MNANELADELADELEEHSQGPNLTQLGAAWFLEIATMLRQQQAEIEALKRGNEATALLNYNKGHEDGRNLVIPSPVKEITDEEMKIVKEAVGNYICTIKMEIDQEKQTFKGYEHCSNLPSLRSELKDAEQALAILRKAQEK